MQETDNGRELNKLYRSAAADKEFLRMLIGEEKKERGLTHETSLSKKSLDRLLSQEDDYSDDHYRKNCRQRFLRSYRLVGEEKAEKKNRTWLEKKQASMEVYNSVTKATICYKLCYVINTAVFCSCNYMANQYRCVTRIAKRKG
ncbi:hypothetical protein DCAR_0728731 [Daucus carota subsp. sativus]|uniref:Uncharacterized protein n=1 Tax=Daucus carota subsp. sativus TaxID=79200 RepID=A0A164TT98_DAUCS|nr:hypothetical protein DCAR_0728731 [Daucus carota subsp. sativus]